MFAIAYRMLGSVGDAEDIVQEAFLRYHQAVSDGTAIESPKAYLATVTTRLSIDSLRSARARREAYVGPWLPEPLVASTTAAGSATAGGVLAGSFEAGSYEAGSYGAGSFSVGSYGADPAWHAVESDSLSMAFLLLLERLNPVERAVFLLHDVFGYPYGEVAAIVGKSEANTRQVAARARRHVSENKPRFEVSRAQRDELASRFFDALDGGDLDGLTGLLAEDVVVYGDGGGVPPSWPHAIVGAERVARLLHGVARQIRERDGRLERVDVNGQPGAVCYDADGGVVSAFCLDIADGRVQTFRSVINPAKLGHLGPLTTFREDLQRPPQPGPPATPSPTA
jgi:RNA polymerase sigma-70 factor (ECF subfamily)